MKDIILNKNEAELKKREELNQNEARMKERAVELNGRELMLNE
jgi:hypothetical protein